MQALCSRNQAYLLIFWYSGEALYFANSASHSTWNWHAEFAMQVPYGEVPHGEECCDVTSVWESWPETPAGLVEVRAGSAPEILGRAPP